MSTPKNFGLRQFALQNVRAQSGFDQVCNLYKSRTASATVATVARNISNHNGGRISKLIGVKKTLVNQMQGMAQNSRPKMKSRALSLATSPNYSIYGQTKLFSSMSSLHGRSSSSSGMSPSLNHRRCLSHIGPRANPVRYIVHQRYHQTGKMQEKRNEDIAQNISQSIKSELMDVDSSTKRLISYSKTRNANANATSNATAEQEERDEAGEEKPQQVQTKKFSYDPLEGWNHPRAVKTTDAMKYAEDEDDLIRQCKPLRRKSRNIRYKDESNNVSVVSQQFVQPSRKLQSQLGGLYVETNKTTRNKKVGQQRPHHDHDHYADELMPVPSKNNDKFAKNHYDRDDDRNMLSSKRDDGDLGRMDEQHYQSKMTANLMSASQRVINTQFEGYCKEMSDSGNKLKQINLVKNMVKAVNPLPLTKSSTRMPGLPKYRPKTVARSKESLKSAYDKSKSKPMAMAKARATSKSAAQLWKRKKSDTATMLDRYGQDYVDKLLERPKRSHSVLPYENPLKKCVYDNMHLMPQVQKGEKRRKQKASNETYLNDNLQNAMQMPMEYSKESAVQRLGTLVEKRATSFFQQSQQRARH